MRASVMVTGPPARIWRSKVGITLPRLPSTLPKRTLQTERPVYEEIEELLGKVELPRFALVEQEVAFVLGRTLAGPSVTPAEVIAATEVVVGAL